MIRTHYDDELFESIDEENAYILRQLAFLTQLQRGGTDDAQWIALKLAITTKQAAQKIHRARA